MSVSIIDELSASCIQAVKQATGLTLDGTPDTFAFLDHYATLECNPSAETLNLLAPLCGAYFGEVVRIHLGPCVWQLAGEQYEKYTLQFQNSSLQFNPMGVAMEVFTKQLEPEWNAHLQLNPLEKSIVESALATLGEVEEEDYFKFTIRYEALDQAVEALARARAL